MFEGFPQLDIHNRKCRVMCEVTKGETVMNVVICASVPERCSALKDTTENTN